MWSEHQWHTPLSPSVPLFLFLPHFDIRDLLRKRRKATWKLFVHWWNVQSCSNETWNKNLPRIIRISLEFLKKALASLISANTNYTSLKAAQWPHYECARLRIVLCSWARHFTLTVPLSTQMYKGVPANLILGVTLRWTSIPSMGYWKYSSLSCFMLQKPGW